MITDAALKTTENVLDLVNDFFEDYYAGRLTFPKTRKGLYSSRQYAPNTYIWDVKGGPRVDSKYFPRSAPRATVNTTPGYYSPRSQPPSYNDPVSYARPSPYISYGAARRRLHNPYPLVRRRYRRSAYVFSSY